MKGKNPEANVKMESGSNTLRQLDFASMCKAVRLLANYATMGQNIHEYMKQRVTRQYQEKIDINITIWVSWQ